MNSSHSNRILYVSGGSRSGKSRYAERRAEDLPGRRSYIATCPRLDAELEARIDLHRRRRHGKAWITIEEPLELARALRDTTDSAVVLVDCLTLWINNLLYRAEQEQQSLSERQLTELCRQVADSARLGERTVIFVSNELGMGLVPAAAGSRLFRDLAGRCNQILAAAADEAVFMVSGLPLILKERTSDDPA